MNTKTLIFFFVALFFLFSCKKNESNSNLAIFDAVFDVDSNLLNVSPITDSSLNFKITPPKNFEKVEESTKFSKDFSVNINNSKIIYKYINKNDSSLMLVLDISNSKINFLENLRVNYQKVFNKENTWKNIQYQDFIYKDFLINQYILQNELATNFTLLCYKNGIRKLPLFGIIFVLNQRTSKNTLKSVESSIGTLNKLLN
jgi:hypothetical protein